MGLTLLHSSAAFRESLTACAAVVEPFGIKLLDEFASEKGWKTPLLGTVGLLAIQIALVDLLREEYNLTPAGMLGHSAGRPCA